MTVTVKKVGGSVAVVIPAAIARELALTDGTALEVSTTADSIVMRRRGRAPRRRIGAIVACIKPASYRRRRRELGEDSPVGKEVW
jgi:antitoxin component of MazEF toxin-antitoxin module